MSGRGWKLNRPRRNSGQHSGVDEEDQGRAQAAGHGENDPDSAIENDRVNVVEHEVGLEEPYREVRGAVEGMRTERLEGLKKQNVHDEEPNRDVHDELNRVRIAGAMTES